MLSRIATLSAGFGLALIAACGTPSETYAIEGDSWVQPVGLEQPTSADLTLVEFFAPT